MAQPAPLPIRLSGKPHWHWGPVSVDRQSRGCPDSGSSWPPSLCPFPRLCLLHQEMSWSPPSKLSPSRVAKGRDQIWGGMGKNGLFCSCEMLTSSFLDKVALDLKLNWWTQLTLQEKIFWIDSKKSVSKGIKKANCKLGLGTPKCLRKAPDQTGAGEGSGAGVGWDLCTLRLLLSLPHSPATRFLSKILELIVPCCFTFSNASTFQTSRQFWLVIKTSFLH